MSSSVTTENGRRSPLAVAGVVAIVVVALVAVLVVSVLSSGTPATSNSLDGHKLASFRLAGLTAGTVASPWSSGHPAAVVFFASWCTPCKAEMPRLAAYVASHDLGDVVVVGVDVNDETGPARSFVRDTGVAFPVGVDPESSLAANEFQLIGLPDTVFVNGDGVVSAVVVGSVSNAVFARDVLALS